MSYWIVICRMDRVGRRRGAYTLTTRQVFATLDAAKAYAATVNRSRDPLVVEGRFSQLRFPTEGGQ